MQIHISSNNIDAGKQKTGPAGKGDQSFGISEKKDFNKPPHFGAVLLRLTLAISSKNINTVSYTQSALLNGCKMVSFVRINRTSSISPSAPIKKNVNVKTGEYSLGSRADKIVS